MTTATFRCTKLDIGTRMFTVGRDYSGEIHEGLRVCTVLDDLGHERVLVMGPEPRFLIGHGYFNPLFAHFVMATVLLDKEYEDDAVADIDCAVAEALSEIPVDGNGFHKGTFRVRVTWTPGENEP